MDISRDIPNHRKRKRRRVINRSPLPAQLLIDGRLEEDVGMISEDLFNELFSHQHRKLSYSFLDSQLTRDL